jgi:hypothetical protein
MPANPFAWKPVERRVMLTTMVYVDAAAPGPTNNGASWAGAYTTLKRA